MSKSDKEITKRLGQTVHALKETIRQPELDRFDCFIEENALEAIVRRMQVALGKVVKKKKRFHDEAFTYNLEDGTSKLMFLYVTGNQDDLLMKELLEWRLSKMKLDPTFLPVYFDTGVTEVLWFAVRIPEEDYVPIEITQAFDDEEKVAKPKETMGKADDAPLFELKKKEEPKKRFKM